jgi:hypothetical protein
MATFSGSSNFCYFADAPVTPGTKEDGMQPAAYSGCIGFGANPSLQSSPTAPGAPASLAGQAIGGAALPLTKEP